MLTWIPVVAIVLHACAGSRSAPASATEQNPMPREGRVRIGSADLYVRDVGQGQPIIVLHGGPDFDHRYLLPDMDRLADSYRLVYYDQRGRGLSGEGVEPEEVTLQSEIDDLDGVREHVGVERVALLGHSFGTLLALEYAIRHPDRVSHLILLNPAPASHADFVLFRDERTKKWPAEMEQRQALAATAAYQEGDPDAVAAYYRVHFKPAFSAAKNLDRLMKTMRASFTKEGVLQARKIEDRLMAETWLVDQYDLLPKLQRLAIPTLVLYGDHDFIPAACSTHIAAAIPKARYLSLRECGHFSYLECPDQVRDAIDSFLR